MTGLVLEGGAMRGMFSAGVMDVMMENGIEFDGVIGVSAGAAFGCNYKSRQIGRTIRYNMKYCADPRYCSFRSLIKTGDLYGADFCYRAIPEELDPFDNETFDSNPTAFYAVCTDVESGRAVYHRCEKAGPSDAMPWIRASASMPLVSRPVEIEGRKYLDGGIADSIPLRYFESIGYERCVVILTQPLGFVKQPASALPLMKLAMRSYPRVAETMAHRHENYNQATAYVEQRERVGAALVIRPETALPISRVEHDAQKLKKVYDLGRAAAQRRLNEIKAFLREENGK